MAAAQSFRDLRVWQRGMDLVVESYRIARLLPANEIYALTGQICRAAVSIPANIAEGYGRLHRGDYVHHLSIAKGSLTELETYLEVVRRLNYACGADLMTAVDLSDHVGRMLTLAIRKLRR